jgi:hypothetical protein
MAQIDPSIAMGYRPIQIESPVNQMAAIAQLRGAQEASQLNALKLKEYEQQQREQNELAKIMGDSTLEFGSEPFMRAVLTKAPRLFEGVAARAAQRENVIAQREARETQTKEREQKLSKEQLQSSLAELASYSTVDDARSALEQKVAAGALTREQADKYGMGLPANDADMPAWQLRTMRSLLTPAEMLQDVRAEKKDVRESERLKLEDDRVRETQRHALAMEEIGRTGANRAELQAAETVRHNKAMENLDARRVGISAAAEARKAEQGGVELSNKEIQKREAVRPQATSAIKGFEAKSESFVKDLKELRDHPGLPEITGFFAGRVAGISKNGRAAQALYDKILAKGGFEALQQMREASKTGGALGNVSNQEGKQLQASFAAIDRKQNAEDVRKALDTAVSDVEGARTRMREAYDETYSYRSDRAAPAEPKPPAAMSEQDKAALNWANSNPKDPRAAQIKQRLGVKQ